MDAAYVKARIEQELNGNYSPEGWGVDLLSCLLWPRIMSYQDDSGRELKLWLVMEERIGAEQSYQVVYDDVEDTFGLAYCVDARVQFYGFYGSFLLTLKSM